MRRYQETSNSHQKGLIPDNKPAGPQVPKTLPIMRGFVVNMFGSYTKATMFGGAICFSAGPGYASGFRIKKDENPRRVRGHWFVKQASKVINLLLVAKCRGFRQDLYRDGSSS